MIHDAIVPVTCDNEDCTEETQVSPHFVYTSYSGDSGQYDTREYSIERQLSKKDEWCVINGKHYCSEECAREAEDGKG